MVSRKDKEYPPSPSGCLCLKRSFIYSSWWLMYLCAQMWQVWTISTRCLDICISQIVLKYPHVCWLQLLLILIGGTAVRFQNYGRQGRKWVQWDRLVEHAIIQIVLQAPNLDWTIFSRSLYSPNNSINVFSNMTSISMRISSDNNVGKCKGFG